jgi:hypothetical protein
MAHFAVALSVPREADSNPRGLKGGHGIKSVEFVESGEMGFADGVSLGVGAEPPPVEDNEYNGSIHRSVKFKVKSEKQDEKPELCVQTKAL